MNIPANLSALPWYAAHCQWVVETYGSCAHTPPVGTVAARATLTRATLTRANLTGANLTGANLDGASDILTLGPLGAEGRLIYAVRHPDGVRIQAGCFWGTAAEIRAAIAVRYADGTGREAHRAAYLGAVDLIEAWAALPVTAS